MRWKWTAWSPRPCRKQLTFIANPDHWLLVWKASGGVSYGAGRRLLRDAAYQRRQPAQKWVDDTSNWLLAVPAEMAISAPVNIVGIVALLTISHVREWRREKAAAAHWLAAGKSQCAPSSMDYVNAVKSIVSSQYAVGGTGLIYNKRAS